MMTLLCQMLTLSTASARYLYGIGYREQELQVAKGTTFNNEKPTGISYASFDGDTNIFIKGDGLLENAQSNRVLLYSNDLKALLPAPSLTENDAFGSNPNMGFI